MTTWTSWRMASSSLTPWLPWVSILPAEQQTLDHLHTWRMASSSLAPWLFWVSILPAEQEALDHLDFLAIGLHLLDTLTLIGLYLTC